MRVGGRGYTDVTIGLRVEGRIKRKRRSSGVEGSSGGGLSSPCLYWRVIGFIYNEVLVYYVATINALMKYLSLVLCKYSNRPQHMFARIPTL